MKLFLFFILFITSAGSVAAIQAGVSPAELVFEHTVFDSYGKSVVEKQLIIFNPNDDEVIVHINTTGGLECDDNLRLQGKSHAKVVVKSTANRKNQSDQGIITLVFEENSGNQYVQSIVIPVKINIQEKSDHLLMEVLLGVGMLLICTRFICRKRQSSA